MQVEYLERFSKDVDNINQKMIKRKLLKFINELKSASNLTQIHNLKKLSGHKSAYRIRIGDYRVGFFLDKNVIQLARVVHRKDIYKVFP